MFEGYIDPSGLLTGEEMITPPPIFFRKNEFLMSCFVQVIQFVYLKIKTSPKIQI